MKYMVHCRYKITNDCTQSLWLLITINRNRFIFFFSLKQYTYGFVYMNKVKHRTESEITATEEWTINNYSNKMSKANHFFRTRMYCTQFCRVKIQINCMLMVKIFHSNELKKEKGVRKWAIKFNWTFVCKIENHLMGFRVMRALFESKIRTFYNGWLNELIIVLRLQYDLRYWIFPT